MSTILDLDAIEKRAQGATPGPYTVHHCDEPTCSLNDGRRITAPSHTPGVDIDLVATVYQGAYDTEFFTHAREDVPALVARIRELEATASKRGSMTPDDIERHAQTVAGFAPHTTVRMPIPTWFALWHRGTPAEAVEILARATAALGVRVRELSEPPVVPAADCPPVEWTDASIVASSDDLTSGDDISVAAYKTTVLGHELCVYAMPDGSWHWQVAHETWCADSRDEHPLPDADAAKAAAIGFARHRYESEQALRKYLIEQAAKHAHSAPYAESYLRQCAAVWMERRLMHAQMARLEALCEQLSQTIEESKNAGEQSV